MVGVVGEIERVVDGCGEGIINGNRVYIYAFLAAAAIVWLLIGFQRRASAINLEELQAAWKFMRAPATVFLGEQCV